MGSKIAVASTFPPRAASTEYSRPSSLAELWFGAEHEQRLTFGLWRGGELALALPLQFHVSSSFAKELPAATHFSVRGRIQLSQRVGAVALFVRAEALARLSIQDFSDGHGDSWVPFSLTPSGGGGAPVSVSIGVLNFL